MRTYKALPVCALVCALSLITAAQQIPAGTHLPVRMGATLSSATAHSNETFEGTLARNVVIRGTTLRAGTPVRGKVTLAKPSGRLQHPGYIALRLTGVEVDGKMMSIHTNAVARRAKSHTKSNVTKIGGGTAAGALIGGLAGGGKGAAIGAGAGAAAGTGAAAYTGKKDVSFPAESVVTFTVTSTAGMPAHHGKKKH